MNPRKHLRRRAAVLLLILFLVAVTAPLVCLLLEAHATEVRCIHNHAGALRALYVAEAGLHDAINELLLDPAWRTGFTAKEFPQGLGHTYTVVLADLPEDKIEVTSTAQTADGYTKTIVATLAGF